MSKNDHMGRHPQTKDVRRPMTGAEYLESLRDGREVWIYGESDKVNQLSLASPVNPFLLLCFYAFWPDL